MRTTTLDELRRFISKLCLHQHSCWWTTVSIVFRLCVCALLSSQRSVHAQTGNLSTNFTVVETGGNYRIWQNATPVSTNNSGQVLYSTNSVTELATGMNFPLNGQWTPSTENIQITAYGGAATNGQHQVNFAANINTSNAVQITTPEGLQLQTTILGMSFFDTSTGNNALFAALTNSTGQLVAPNQVVYSNAFTDCDADVLYIYRRSGMEQDVVIQQQLPSPTAYNLNPSTTWLQVWTEFINPPTPVIENLPNGAGERLDFGTMKMEQGKAFIFGNESDSIPVIKQWTTIQGRTFLIEEVPLNAIAPQLQTLPPCVIVRPTVRDRARVIFGTFQLGNPASSTTSSNTPKSTRLRAVNSIFTIIFIGEQAVTNFRLPCRASPSSKS
jgi:hypothetical protein